MANPAPLILAGLTTPGGGRIDYAFAPELFHYGSAVVYSPVLKTRAVSGPGVPPGTWQYDFDSPHWTLPVTAIITSPCGKERYVTNAIGPAADERPWAIGSLARKEMLALDDTVLETEELDWKSPRRSPTSRRAAAPSRPTCRSCASAGSPVGARPTDRVHLRRVWPTASRAPNNFNDHGRAREILETGESGALTRKTTRTFFYGASTDPSFGTYIVDQAGHRDGAGARGRQRVLHEPYEYETSGVYRGFLKAQTDRGIRTEYTQELVATKPSGNVKTAKDGNGNVTSFAYAWGRTRQITTPLYTITRVINPDGSPGLRDAPWLYDVLLLRPAPARDPDAPRRSGTRPSPPTTTSMVGR